MNIFFINIIIAADSIVCECWILGNCYAFILRFSTNIYFFEIQYLQLWNVQNQDIFTLPLSLFLLSLLRFQVRPTEFRVFSTNLPQDSTSPIPNSRHRRFQTPSNNIPFELNYNNGFVRIVL